MKPRFLDTSIPLCVITGAPKKYFDSCVKLMERVEEGKYKVVTTVFTVTELAYILGSREKFDMEKVNDKVVSFLDCLGLKLLDVEAILCREAIETSQKFSIDFVDSYNILTMRRKGISEIHSLDPHYDMFKDVDRIIEGPD